MGDYPLLNYLQRALTSRPNYLWLMCLNQITSCHFSSCLPEGVDLLGRLVVDSLPPEIIHMGHKLESISENNEDQRL